MDASSQTGDAIEQLLRDHREVELLLARFDFAMREDKDDAARAVHAALESHVGLEEELFYPALRGQVDDAALEQVLSEHRVIADMIAKIVDARDGDRHVDGRMMLLRRYFERHVDAEEGAIMVQARACGVDLDRIGRELVALKRRLGAPSGA